MSITFALAQLQKEIGSGIVFRCFLETVSFVEELEGRWSNEDHPRGMCDVVQNYKMNTVLILTKLMQVLFSSINNFCRFSTNMCNKYKNTYFDNISVLFPTEQTIKHHQALQYRTHSLYMQLMETVETAHHLLLILQADPKIHQHQNHLQASLMTLVRIQPFRLLDYYLFSGNSVLIIGSSVLASLDYGSIFMDEVRCGAGKNFTKNNNQTYSVIPTVLWHARTCIRHLSDFASNACTCDWFHS